MPLKMGEMVRNWSGQPDPEWTAFSMDMMGHALMNDLKIYDFDRCKTLFTLSPPTAFWWTWLGGYRKFPWLKAGLVPVRSH